jgi:hypothetical protein
MKRVLSISLAVLAAFCLFCASYSHNTAQAQSEQGEANGRGHVHQINHDNDGDVEDKNSKDPTEAPELNPYGLPANGRALTTGGTGTVTPKITNHGGPVIGTPTIYIIFYGNWNQANGSDTPAGQQIIRDWGHTIGGTPHYLLNTSYPGVSGNTVWGGETTDTGSQGTNLSDAKVFSVVKSAINTGKLPYDASGVYFVVSSSNVSESSGFCSRYCGWHTAGNNTNGARIRYSFVGNANRCLSSCSAQTNSPNGNAGVDGAISVLTHELEEANTDPDLNAWFDSQGAENADKCAWTFGHFQYQTASGAWANMHIGTRDYLIQRNLQQISSGDLCKVDSTHN